MNKSIAIGILACVGVAGTLAMVFAGGSTTTPPLDVTPADPQPEAALVPDAPLAMNSTDEIRTEPNRDERRGGRRDRGGSGGPGGFGDWDSPEARKRMEDWLASLPAERRAEMEKRMEEMRKNMLARFDKDGDGVISDAEREAARKEREERDAQRRAEARTRAEEVWGGPVPLSDRELEAAGRLFMQNIPQETRQEMRSMWQNADADGDGQVSDSEQQAMRQQFESLMAQQMQRAQQDLLARFDADGDGTLNDRERDTAAEGIRSDINDASAMRRFDTNNDGRIDESELDRYIASFDSSDRSADMNRDGSIDTNDFDRFMQLLQRR